MCFFLFKTIYLLLLISNNATGFCLLPNNPDVHGPECGHIKKNQVRRRGLYQRQGERGAGRQG